MELGGGYRHVPIPRPTDKYRPSCTSRTADGFIRGSLVGLAWGWYFYPLDELAATGWMTQAPPPSAPPPTTAATLVRARHLATQVVLPRTKSMAQASLMFGCFLGTFSGATCLAEKVTGSRNSACVFVGGAAAGALLAARNGSRRAVLATALGTGLLTSVLHVLANGP